MLAQTEMYETASWSLATSLATMITFAPFSASWRATLRPIPFEPPVMRTVCAQLLARSRRVVDVHGSTYPAVDWEFILPQEESHPVRAKAAECVRNPRRQEEILT
jgi:hypothetical protein